MCKEYHLTRERMFREELWDLLNLHRLIDGKA